jgi:hypothetical protein
MEVLIKEKAEIEAIKLQDLFKGGQEHMKPTPDFWIAYIPDRHRWRRESARIEYGSRGRGESNHKERCWASSQCRRISQPLKFRMIQSSVKPKNPKGGVI